METTELIISIYGQKWTMVLSPLFLSLHRCASALGLDRALNPPTGGIRGSSPVRGTEYSGSNSVVLLSPSRQMLEEDIK
jgi:hypothetical protein